MHAWEVGGKPLAALENACRTGGRCGLAEGRRLLTAARKLGLWDAAEGQPLATSPAPPGRIRGVAFAGDGRRRLAGGHDRTLRVWELPR